MATNLNQRILIIFLFFFIVRSFNCELFAQSIQFLEGASLEKAVVENTHKGLSPFFGMNVQYTIKVNSLEEVSKNSVKIIAEIGKIPGFIDCNIDRQKDAVIVKCQKDKSKENIAKIKEKLALFNIKMINSEEHIFKN